MIIATSSAEDGYAIGKDNKLLWSYSSDMNYFKSKTLGGIVVFGMSTFQGIPFANGLPDRKNFVLSRTPKKSLLTQDVVYFSGVDMLLKTIRMFNYGNVWLCGGAQIYNEMLPHVSEIHHTTVKGSFPDADTHYDMDFLNNGEWSLYSREVLCDNCTVSVWRRIK